MAAGMMLHWCMLGVTILLLVSEVAISQLCKSVITLLDGFHTLFILIHMALPPPQNAPPSLDSPSSLPVSSPVRTSIRNLPGAHTSTHGASISDEPTSLLPIHTEASPMTSSPLCSPRISPPTLNGHVSYTSARIQAFGEFIASLLLASLSISYLLQLISIYLEPHTIQRPLPLVVVGGVSFLHKMLVLRVYWCKLQMMRAGANTQPIPECHLEVNQKVLAAEETKGPAKPGPVPNDVDQDESPADNAFCEGALFLCNPRASSVPDADSTTPQQEPRVYLHAAAPLGRRSGEVMAGFTYLKSCKCESYSEDVAEMSRDNVSVKGLESSPVFMSTCDRLETSSQRPRCLLSVLWIMQNLFTAVLSLISGLVMLLVGPQCHPNTGACDLLVYLDPGLSLLAVIMLIATAAPQLHKHGLLLLQATPPNICVSDLRQCIAGCTGVRDVHHVHIWQLTQSFIVASVHVQCHAGFPEHRCANLVLEVTKVLQSVGVSCCTVQPEFDPCTGCSAGSDGSDPSLSRPPPTACSLACGKACAANMCCSFPGEENSSLQAP